MELHEIVACFSPREGGLFLVVFSRAWAGKNTSKATPRKAVVSSCFTHQNNHRSGFFPTAQRYNYSTDHDLRLGRAGLQPAFAHIIPFGEHPSVFLGRPTPAHGAPVPIHDHLFTQDLHEKFRPVLQCLPQMHRPDLLAARKVRDRPGELQDPAICPG